ncbi:hypothetical protein EX30DRAFT_345435 [Ascodesmis nigricans]|uniref:Uncharacterized protein n=1 Tax=Ascodesmis nigricans TaxID=341454 RepID=A0A4S2N671_9PEZI|nr:hypothetical protein EX30DRAFT_345435 [Ascodesmis nigricans]
MSLALVRPKTPRPRDIKTTILDTFSHVLPSASSSAVPATPTPPTSSTKTFHVYHTHWDYNLLIYAAAKKDWTPSTSTPIYEVSNNPYSSIGVRIKTPKSKYLSTGGGLKLPSSSSPSSTASASSYDLTDCSPTLPPPPQIRHTFAAAKFHAFSSDIGICLGDPEIGNLASPSDVSLSAPKSGKLPSPPPPSSPMPPRTPGGSLNSPDPLSPNSLGGIYELPGSFVGESCGTRTRKIPVFECMENVSGMVHERYRWTWEVPGDGFVEEVDNENDMSPPTPGEQDAPIMLRIVNPDVDMDGNIVEEEHDWIHGSVTLGFQTTPGTPPRSASKPSTMMVKRSSTASNKKTLNSPLPKPPHKRYYTWRRSEDSVWSHDWELIEDPIIDFAAEEEARKTMLARIAAEEELRKEREVRELRRLREAVAARIARAENQNRGNNIININNTATANTENGKPKVKPNRPAPLPPSVMVRPPPLPWPLPPQRSPPSYPPPPVPKASDSSLPLPQIPAGPPTPPFEPPRFTAPPHIRPITSPSAQATVALGKPPGPTMGVSRDGSGNVVARWTEASWSLKKKGKLEIVKGRGEKWELMVVVTVMALVERERRRAGPG